MKDGIFPFTSRLLLAALLLAVIVVPGCKKKKADDRKRPERRAANSSQEDPAADDNIVARVGDLEVTRAEYEAELARLKPPGGANKVQQRNAERQALKSLVHRRLVELAAAAEGIKVPESTIETEWLAAVTTLGGESRYEEYLTRSGHSEESHREAIRSKLQRTLLREKLYPETITEEQIRAYYDGYEDNPGRGEKVRVSRILLKVDEAAHESKWQEAEEKLSNIEGEIKAGLPFEEAVEKYSEGPYAARGGDMGWATDKRRPLAVFGPAMTMKQGEFKGPIRVKMGVQLITVTKVKNDAAGAFEAERQNIREVLEQQRDQRNDRRLYEKLRARYRVEKFL
jgi:peptidyl-prolyl cis-trans isomerase SurA